MFRSSPTPDLQWPSNSAFLPSNTFEQQARGTESCLGVVVSVSLLTLVRPWIHLSSLAHYMFLCPVLPSAVSPCLRKGHLFNAIQKAFFYTVKLLLHLYKWGNLWKHILKHGNRLWKIVLLKSKAQRLLKGVVLYASVRKKTWWRQLWVFLASVGKLNFNFFFFYHLWSKYLKPFKDNS